MAALSNIRRERFAQAFATGLTAGEAYRRAGYRANAGNAARLRAHAEVRARVAELVEVGTRRAEVSVEKVLRELARIGFADVRRMHDAEGGLRRIAELPDDIAAAVASYEVVKRTVPGIDGAVEVTHKIKVWDKARALEMIGRYLAMFIDRNKLARDEDPGAIEVDDVRARLADEIDRIAARLGKGALDPKPE